MNALKRLFLLITFSGASVLTLLAGISPDQASTNLAGWWRFLAGDPVPDFLFNKNSESYAIGSAAILILLFLAGLGWFPKVDGRQKPLPSGDGIRASGNSRVKLVGGSISGNSGNGITLLDNAHLEAKNVIIEGSSDVQG